MLRLKLLGQSLFLMQAYTSNLNALYKEIVEEIGDDLQRE